MTATRYVTIAIATIAGPAAPSAGKPTPRLIGVALFVAERCALGRWSFALDAATDDGGDDQLLDWVTDHLPQDATVIGWRLGDKVVPALLAAAERAEAEVAQRFASACARTFSSPAIDLADMWDGVADPPFAGAAKPAGIPFRPTTERDRSAAWFRSVLDAIRAALEEQVVALWGGWLRRDGRHPDAAAISARWLRTRS